ncbi:MAG: YeeE/YedE family protein [Flavobacteriaceae bacterium]|nr:YeeE/YedE family protein [Flavobacteriaceae bacterium]
MGPLVPYILSSEFSLLAALLLGIGFGFVLEQAGFSSTKKLVGLFYGYDFTVLRVFFTAGVTAMIGVLLLSHYDLLDIRLLYINPTFLKSAIVGGLVMGAGFIIGGFCPGTSVCAAAIGKIDAMAFIFGSVIGIFIFMEYYPLFEDLYFANDMGPLKINDVFGISPLYFAFAMTFVALAAFYFTWRIENVVNKRSNEIAPDLKRNYIVAMALPIVVLLLILILPSKQEIISNKISKEDEQEKCDLHAMSADKLAYEITNNYYQLNVIDVRPEEEFKKNHLPLAINIPFDQITEREWESFFKQTIKKNIFYADNDTLARMSLLKAQFVGESQNYILDVSADDFNKLFFEPQKPSSLAEKQKHDEYTFRLNASEKMKELVKSFENMSKPVKRVVKVAAGGC